MQIFDTDTRVFYNPDCQKYGVERLTKGIVLHCKDGITRQLYKWAQVDPHPGQPRRSAYTPYKAVAERWADSLRDGGVIEVRADMEGEY
jgi:hypothetical protein